VTVGSRIIAGALLAAVLAAPPVAAAPSGNEETAGGRAAGNDAPAAHGASEAAAGNEAGSDEPAPVRITTAVEPKDVTIGTPFRYTLRVEADEGVEVLVPVLADRIGDFTITDFGEVEHDDGGGDRTSASVSEYWYTLLAYEAGSQFIPGPPVGWRIGEGEVHRVDAPRTLVNLVSLLARSDSSEVLRDIKGPMRPPVSRTLLWLGLLAVVLAALAVWMVVRWQGARGDRAVSVQPAHVVALEALARLSGSRALEDGRYDEFYVRLSSIVRDYLEARFGLRAPEMTTEEFLSAAHRGPQLDPTQRSALAQFLGQADLVKFARLVPGAADGRRAYDAARELVEATRLVSDDEEADRAAA